MLHKILIVLANIKFCKFYSCEKNTVQDLLAGKNLLPEAHIKPEKHNGGFSKSSSTQSHFFEPHTDPKQIDLEHSAKNLIDELNSFINNHEEYNKIILAAEPKLLGQLRKLMPVNLKNLISEEISKDLVKEQPEHFEKSIFKKNKLANQLI
ncbi:MAG: host attachment protein [Rickettsiaceae bacterium]|nr:host attachment protein [Rickettsiaceae bacterium]